MLGARDPVEDFSALALSLTAALGDDEPWRPFLLQMSAQVHAKHATLILLPRDAGGQGTVITPTSSAQDIAEYRDRYLRIDPFVRLPEGEVVVLYEYIAPADYDRIPDYKNWFDAVDASHILGVDLRLASGFEARLRLSRAIGGPEFTKLEKQWVARIIPHLRQALEMHQRLILSRTKRAVMVDTVQQAAVGTVLLNVGLDVVKVNEVGASILAEADGIGLKNGKICLPDAAAQKNFETIVSNLRHVPAGSRSLLRVKRLSGLDDILVIAQPVPTPEFMRAGTAPALALLIIDPARKPRIDGARLSHLFDLTPTEGAISAALGNGASASEAAQSLGIADSTVRSHLRSIFSKLGVHRQSQLVHLIHSSIF